MLNLSQIHNISPGPNGAIITAPIKDGMRELGRQTYKVFSKGIARVQDHWIICLNNEHLQARNRCPTELEYRIKQDR